MSTILKTLESAIYNLYSNTTFTGSVNLYKGIQDGLIEEVTTPAIMINALSAQELLDDTRNYRVEVTVIYVEMAPDSRTATGGDNNAEIAFATILDDDLDLSSYGTNLYVRGIYEDQGGLIEEIDGDAWYRQLTLEIVCMLT